MRISAHFLRGDVKFSPVCPGRGGEPVGEAGRETRGFSRERGGFSHGLGAGVAPNGGRRTDGRLRRAHTLGVDGRRGALSDRLSLYIMCPAARRRFAAAQHQTKSPHRRPSGQRWGLCCGGASARRAQVFSLCRRAYRLFSWGCGRRPVLFRLSVRAFRPVQRGLRERGPRRAQLPREPAPPSPGGRSGS